MFKNKHNTEVMDLKLEVVHKQHTVMMKLENLDESIFNKELNLSNFSKPKPEVKRIKRKKPKPVQDPKAPKKPSCSFLLYSKQERPRVKAEFPDFSMTQITKELGKRWNAMNPAIKKSYEQRFKTLRSQYEKDLLAYNRRKLKKEKKLKMKMAGVIPKKKDPIGPKKTSMLFYFVFTRGKI